MTENKIDPTDLIKLLKTSDVDKVIKKLTATITNRFKQELKGENEELLEREILKYRSKVSRRTWHIAQKWCKWNDEGPVLMPDNTRFYYRKGKTEVMVQEFAPQMRMMKFVGSLRRKSNAEEISQAEAKKVYSYSLALPYMVFIHKFVNGMLASTYVSFCDRPLKKLTERPYKPYLCNIDAALQLCTIGVQTSLMERGNLTQQAALLLSHFWQSVYNEDLSAHYWEYRRNFTYNDERLKTLEAWQEASIENPLFVIDDVKWLPYDEEDEYGKFIVKLFETDEENAKFQEDLYDDLSEQFVKEVQTVFNVNTDTVDSKVKALSTDDVARELLDVLLEIQKNSKEGTNG